MAEGQEAEDRTEAPTPRRLEQAREEGQVPLSREAVALAGLSAAGLAAALALPPLGMEMLRAMRDLLAAAPEADAAPGAALAVLRAAAWVLLPVLGATALGAVLATLGQTGGLVRGKALMPDPSRLNPLSSLKRLFSLGSLGEMLRNLAKLGVVGLALWRAVDLPGLRAALGLSPAALLAEAGRGAQRLLVACLVAFALIAAADLLWVRLRHMRQLRMSREELREEAKDTEGDPHIKAKLRQLRQSRSRRRMLAAVPKASVVITNPTHYAVALAYDQGGSAAPRLVAKGVDAMAARIRAKAQENEVPLVANPPLARALYRLEVETEIPQEHWQAVAEILAYVWRLQGRAGGGG